MTSVDGRRYQITRDQWQRVNCVVLEELLGPPRQLYSLGIYCERESGFGLGKTSPNALELALAILVDHSALPVENTAWILTHGFCTDDRRVLEVWMKHGRLRDQWLVNPNNPNAPITVSEWELQRLLKSGFLTSEAEVRHESLTAERERAAAKYVDAEGQVHYERRFDTSANTKPDNEVKP